MKIAEVLQAVEHRPYPLPRGPWIMVQVWHELLFAHYPLAPEVLRPLIPDTLEIDTFEGEAWIGIVPFRMSGVRPHGLPTVHNLSAFPELNVRTYVKRNGVAGVYFFSLDAGNPIAVAIARTIFHLPYFNAQMSLKHVGDIVHYTSQRIQKGAPHAEYIARYRPIASVVEAHAHSIEAWLTERYCLYTVAGSALYKCDIHHALWPLQEAELEIERDTMALSHGIHLPDTRPLLHYSLRQDVLVWPIRRIL